MCITCGRISENSRHYTTRQAHKNPKGGFGSFLGEGEKRREGRRGEGRRGDERKWREMREESTPLFGSN